MSALFLLVLLLANRVALGSEFPGCDCVLDNTEHCNEDTGTCFCVDGWTGARCDMDIDECADIIFPCPGPHRVCHNTPGSVECHCDTGFIEFGDSGECVDIDYCSSNPCAQTCTNGAGSYTCTCAEGFIPSGDDCQDVNECDISTLNTCSQRCRNTNGGFICECFDGFTLDVSDRISCTADSTDVECDENDCTQNCRKVGGNNVCYCNTGYKLNDDGARCDDINECTTGDPCVDGNCQNTVGGFSCTCPAGRKLASDLVTCKECVFGKFGVECVENCTCNGTNTEYCNKTDGFCVCNTGWEGNACSDDVNECNQMGISCGENSVCDNIPGSYRCLCNIGYFRSEGACVGCGPTSFGQDCSEVCSCVTANTADCNNYNGSCTCNQGWKGNNCQTDIDECDASNSDPCPGPNDSCSNLNGTFLCVCDVGFQRFGTANCTPCSPVNYGQDCSQTCSCETANTADCNDVNGTCTCKTGWTGANCETDVDECEDGTDRCPGPNDSCVDIDGSFQCLCDKGYARDTTGSDCSDIDECQSDNDCRDDNQRDCYNTQGSYVCQCKANSCTSFEVAITLAYSGSENSSNVFDNSTDDFATLAGSVQSAITSYGQQRIGNALLAVRIYRFRNGSVVADTIVDINNNATDDPPVDAASLIHSLKNEDSLIIDGTIRNVEAVAPQEGVAFADGDSMCDVFNRIATCEANYECQEFNGTISCRETDSDDDDDLILGLAIGIPVFFAVSISIGVMVYCCVRRRNAKKGAHDGSAAENRDAPFAKQLAIKNSGGETFGQHRYSHYANSESPSSTSSEERRGHQPWRKPGRLDYQDSAWYDNSGFARSEYGQSRNVYRPTETFTPQNDYSQGYMPPQGSFLPSKRGSPSVYQDCPSVYQDCPSVYQDYSSVYQDCSSVYQDCPSVYQDCSSVYQDCSSICHD